MDIDEDRGMTNSHDGTVGKGIGGVQAIGGILKAAAKLSLHLLDSPTMKPAVTDDQVFMEQFIVGNVDILFFSFGVIRAAAKDNNPFSSCGGDDLFGIMVGFDNNFQLFVATQENDEMFQGDGPQIAGDLYHSLGDIFWVGDVSVVEMDKGVDTGQDVMHVLQPRSESLVVWEVEMKMGGTGDGERGHGEECRQPGFDIPVVEKMGVGKGGEVGQGKNPRPHSVHGDKPGSDFPVVQESWRQR